MRPWNLLLPERLAHTARKAAAASLLLGRRSISGRACSSGGSHARGRLHWSVARHRELRGGIRLYLGKKLDKRASVWPC